MSSNGTVVVGQSQSSTISQAFVWTPTTGMVGLGEDTMPLALSADGSIILCNGATGAFLLTTNAPAPTSAQLLQNLIADVDHINLARGIQNSLDAKLTNALDALDAHSEGFRLDTIGKLQAFINEVNAQRNKKITGADADHLIAEANNVIAKLNS